MEDMRDWTDGQFEDAGFDCGQMREIREGFENGLTSEQVTVYANRPGYSATVMQQIRLGFESGLSPEQVAMYAKPEFSSLQMNEIRTIYEKGLNGIWIEALMHPELRWSTMYEARKGIEHGLTAEQVAIYARPDYNGLQAKQIRLGFEAGLTGEQVAVYARPSTEWWRMRAARHAIEHGLTAAEVATCFRPDITRISMKRAISILESTGDMEEIEKYLDSAERATAEAETMAIAVLVKPGEAPETIECAANRDQFAKIARESLGENAVEVPIAPGYRILMPNMRIAEEQPANRAIFATAHMEHAGCRRTLYDMESAIAPEGENVIRNGELYMISYGNMLVVGENAARPGTDVPTLTPEQAARIAREYEDPMTGPAVEAAIATGTKPSDITMANISKLVHAVPRAEEERGHRPRLKSDRHQTKTVIDWAEAARRAIEHGGQHEKESIDEHLAGNGQTHQTR